MKIKLALTITDDDGKYYTIIEEHSIEPKMSLSKAVKFASQLIIDKLRKPSSVRRRKD